MAKIAITDGLSKSAIKLLLDAGHEVQLEPQKLNGFDAVVIRSATKLTKDIIEAAPSLRLIGRAGVGVDNIDLDAASSAGILVCNTPSASTQSVVELTIGHLLASKRNSEELNYSGKDWDLSVLAG